MNKPKQILQVGSNSVHFRRFVEEIEKRKIDFCILSEEPINNKKKIIQISFRSKNPIILWENYQSLKKTITKNKPSLIHIHQLNRIAFIVSWIASKIGIPIISTAWGSDVLIIPNKNWIFEQITKKILKNSTIVTADSHEMIRAMNKIVPSSTKYVWLQYGVDLIKEEKKENIIYSNRLHNPIYRIDKIIHYFNDFSIENPNWKLVIGATGTLTHELKNKVTNLNLQNKIEFVGWLNKTENNSWYAKSKIYISIPESDGTSVSLLEAMSAGCIPIVSNLSVSKEWIEDGKNGIIEDVENPIIKALKIPFETAKQFNFELIKEKADRNICISTFINLYSKYQLKQ